jgi:GntR family transcriptional regulator
MSGPLADFTHVPLYHRIFSVLRQRVLDETYPVGSKLAAEDELADEFGVSRATIRQAVGKLVEAQILSRKQGRGTFVLPTAHERLGQAFHGSLTDLMNETRRARVRDVEVEHGVPLPNGVADQLQLTVATGTVVRRTRTVDGKPFAYTANYLPDAHGRRLTKRALQRSSLMQLLENQGVVFAGARQTIQSQPADIVVSEALEISLSAPILFVERLLWGTDSDPIQLVRSWYHGDLYKYTVTLDRVDGSLSRQLA